MIYKHLLSYIMRLEVYYESEAILDLQEKILDAEVLYFNNGNTYSIGEVNKRLKDCIKY